MSQEGVGVRVARSGWRYIFIVANPAEPVDLVKQLVGVVGKESEETVMNVAEWLEQKGRLEGIRTTLLTLLRLRFGDVPERTVERIQGADGLARRGGRLLRQFGGGVGEWEHGDLCAMNVK